MKYAIDSEFIDTPECSALISLAVVAEDGRSKYFEFPYLRRFLTPWLEQNVEPHLTQRVKWKFSDAADTITKLVGDDTDPEFWAYFGAYDWYWFCRLFGGFMALPARWPNPILCRDLAQYQRGGVTSETKHNALADAMAAMEAVNAKVKRREIKPMYPEIMYRTQR